MPGDRAAVRAAGLGVVAGLALVLGSVLVPPLVLAPAGTSFDVPAFAPSGQGSTCGASPCGSAGVAELQVRLLVPARLSGTVSFDGPLDLIVANTPSAECGLSTPVPPCPGWTGPNDEYSSSGVTGRVALQALPLNFSGPDNLLPPGAWTIYFVNWSPVPVHVTVDSDVRTTTAW
jgi:hypothetical protein